MMFDVKTLMFFMALSGLLMAGAITLADAQERGGLNGLRTWTLALLVQAGGWLVLVAVMLAVAVDLKKTTAHLRPLPLPVAMPPVAGRADRAASGFKIA